MGRLPVLKPREIVGILEKLGFNEIRQRGAHSSSGMMMEGTTTVPFHKGRDISPTLLRQICKDIGMTPEEFVQHR